MFDIGWGEFVLIGTVALVVIGPKELPGVLRTVGQTIGKARRMAAEFQGQFREVLREAEIEEARSALNAGIQEGFGGLSSASSMTPPPTEYKPPQIPMPDGSAPGGESPTAAEPVIPPAPPAPELTPDQIRAAFGSGTDAVKPAEAANASGTPPAGGAPPAASGPATPGVSTEATAKPARARRKANLPAVREDGALVPVEDKATKPARAPRARKTAAASAISAEKPATPRAGKAKTDAGQAAAARPGRKPATKTAAPDTEQAGSAAPGEVNSTDISDSKGAAG